MRNIHYVGSLDTVREEIKAHGRDEILALALEQVVPEVTNLERGQSAREDVVLTQFEGKIEHSEKQQENIDIGIESPKDPKIPKPH